MAARSSRVLSATANSSLSSMNLTARMPSSNTMQPLENILEAMSWSLALWNALRALSWCRARYSARLYRSRSLVYRAETRNCFFSSPDMGLAMTMFPEMYRRFTRAENSPSSRYAWRSAARESPSKMSRIILFANVWAHCTLMSLTEVWCNSYARLCCLNSLAAPTVAWRFSDTCSPRLLLLVHSWVLMIIFSRASFVRPTCCFFAFSETCLWIFRSDFWKVLMPAWTRAFIILEFTCLNSVANPLTSKSSRLMCIEWLSMSFCEILAPLEAKNSTMSPHP
mmetsp:Transcript_27323/g.52989  ORF Transcript_27323/g.52989 Transcript_27323/m.52989 type:complete len:281 (+) Transcript_27323:298-1140(+)